MQVKICPFLLSLLLASVPSTSLRAQSFVDETVENIPSDALSLMKSKIDTVFCDPKATEFKGLSFKTLDGQMNINNEPLHGFRIDGKVNAKNRYGGYEGYKPFSFFSDPVRWFTRSPTC